MIFINLINLLGIPLSHKSYALNLFQAAHTLRAPQNKIIKAKGITSVVNQYKSTGAMGFVLFSVFLHLFFEVF